MDRALHVLNGDATLHSFKDTGIAGEVIVWRDVFSEGPLLPDIHSREFWIGRSEWICKTFSITAEQYQFDVIDELDPLREHIHFNEIMLWFEFDLHCQVNLLGVLQLLAGMDPEKTNLCLICPSAFPGVESFAGIGQLDSAQLGSLHLQKVKLNAHDLALANEAWQAYTSYNAERLKTWLNSVSSFGNLVTLKPAFEAQLQRLQLNADGLNYIHNKLLQIYNSGHKSRAAIYEQFWKTEKIFGMGDAEIDIYLKELAGRSLIPNELINT